MCWPWLDARHSSKWFYRSPSQLNKLLWLGLAERRYGWKGLSCNAHFCPLVQTRLVFQRAWVKHHPQPVTKWHWTFPKNKWGLKILLFLLRSKCFCLNSSSIKQICWALKSWPEKRALPLRNFLPQCMRQFCVGSDKTNVGILVSWVDQGHDTVA